MWTHTLLMVAGYNFAHGTKNTPPRLTELQDLLVDYQRTRTHRDCELWAHYGPLIAEDFGDSSLIHDEEWCESVFGNWLSFDCFAITEKKLGAVL